MDIPKPFLARRIPNLQLDIVLSNRDNLGSEFHPNGMCIARPDYVVMVVVVVVGERAQAPPSLPPPSLLPPSTI